MKKIFVEFTFHVPPAGAAHIDSEFFAISFIDDPLAQLT